jgi:hypothetical protein
MRKILPVVALVLGLGAGLSAGFSLGCLYARPGPTVEVELVVADPKDPRQQTVLRYRGADRAAALAGGNVSALGVMGVVARDEQDPQAGTVSWRAFSVRGEDGTFAGRGEPIELRVVRVDRGRGMDWELSDESVRRVLEELARPGR